MKVLNQAIGKNFAIYHGDSCEVLKGIPDSSIHYSVTSIPFASLYTYSNSDRDMGNCRSYEEFAEQYMFLGREWFRVMMPGRNVSIHCMKSRTRTVKRWIWRLLTMRDILFRGKCVDNGKWVEGSFWNEIPGESCGILPAGSCASQHVDRETVSQFTGLTDKNGKRIFEGDIIKADNRKQSSVSVVKFGDYYPEMFYKMLDMLCPGRQHLLAFGFYAESIRKHEEMILFQSQCVEIIGNIHDNPELLEV